MYSHQSDSITHLRWQNNQIFTAGNSKRPHQAPLPQRNSRPHEASQAARNGSLLLWWDASKVLAVSKTKGCAWVISKHYTHNPNLYNNYFKSIFLRNSTGIMGFLSSIWFCVLMGFIPTLCWNENDQCDHNISKSSSISKNDMAWYKTAKKF